MQQKEASRPSDQLLGKPVRVVIPVQVSDSAKREQKWRLVGCNHHLSQNAFELSRTDWECVSLLYPSKMRSSSSGSTAVNVASPTRQKQVMRPRRPQRCRHSGINIRGYTFSSIT
ncbi:hypothetical protein PISMIDRAFT_243502 [Pisolithus microcarpus 441]|uniref:Uncharacterized protein n=1 Tax=Pisolithus microcarpus 441 TaxID=765257 RepID=A0A0C9ZWS4_9AGAM|nr:hypothetical protein PISMIDRAFT_243502 [Pisolithus microcarpus 441]